MARRWWITAGCTPAAAWPAAKARPRPRPSSPLVPRLDSSGPSGWLAGWLAGNGGYSVKYVCGAAKPQCSSGAHSCARENHIQAAQASQPAPPSRASPRPGAIGLSRSSAPARPVMAAVCAQRGGTWHGSWPGDRWLGPWACTVDRRLAAVSLVVRRPQAWGSGRVNVCGARRPGILAGYTAILCCSWPVLHTPTVCDLRTSHCVLHWQVRQQGGAANPAAGGPPSLSSFLAWRSPALALLLPRLALPSTCLSTSICLSPTSLSTWAHKRFVVEPTRRAVRVARFAS